MMNKIILVGRVVNKARVFVELGDKKYFNITIAVPRNYKNEKGEYDTDFFDIVLWDKIAKNVNEFVKTGDLIGINGRIETREIDIKDSEYKQKVIEVIAEKVTFLSSTKKESEEK